jgi:hypothetical protein
MNAEVASATPVTSGAAHASPPASPGPAPVPASATAAIAPPPPLAPEYLGVDEYGRISEADIYRVCLLSDPEEDLQAIIWILDLSLLYALT